MPKIRSYRLIGIALAAALVPSGAIALADVLDPSMPAIVTLGAPKGFAPSERIDAQRTGRSAVTLPSHPTETWRRQMNGGLDLPPVIDEEGSILVVLLRSLSVPELMKLSTDGKELWRRRIGTEPAITRPVLMSDGTVVVVNGAGVAWGVGTSGAVRFASALGVRGRDAADVSPLATEDGSVVIAAGRDLVEIGADGSIRARASLKERAVGALLRGADGVIVTTESGAVLTWKSPGEPRVVGALGGTPRSGATLADRRTLLAVVDGRHLVALDLPTGTTHVRSSALSNPEFFDAPPAVTSSGLAITTTYGGLLLGIDASGTEKVHVIVEKQLVSFLADGGAPGVELKANPPVIIDDEGRVAFVRTVGRLGIVSPEGAVTIVNDHICPSGAPIAVVPAGPKKIVVACHDGTIWMLGES